MTWGWDSIRIQWLQQDHIACSVQVKWLPLNFKWVVGYCYYYVSRRKIVGMCSSRKNVCIIILCLTHILPFAFRFIRWGVDCWEMGKVLFFVCITFICILYCVQQRLLYDLPSGKNVCNKSGDIDGKALYVLMTFIHFQVLCYDYKQTLWWTLNIINCFSVTAH